MQGAIVCDQWREMPAEKVEKATRDDLIYVGNAGWRGSDVREKSHWIFYISRKSSSVISPMCSFQSKTFVCTRRQDSRTAFFFCLLLMCLETT